MQNQGTMGRGQEPCLAETTALGGAVRPPFCPPLGYARLDQARFLVNVGPILSPLGAHLDIATTIHNAVNER